MHLLKLIIPLIPLLGSVVFARPAEADAHVSSDCNSVPTTNKPGQLNASSVSNVATIGSPISPELREAMNNLSAAISTLKSGTTPDNVTALIDSITVVQKICRSAQANSLLQLVVAALSSSSSTALRDPALNLLRELLPYLTSLCQTTPTEVIANAAALLSTPLAPKPGQPTTSAASNTTNASQVLGTAVNSGSPNTGPKSMSVPSNTSPSTPPARNAAPVGVSGNAEVADDASGCSCGK